MFAPILVCGDRQLVLDRPRICGIVNVTPDSFSDGGQWLAPEDAIAHGLRLVEQGADLLDVGGESTRPGAESVSAADEIARVIPVIAALAQRSTVPISVDTSKAQVMRAAIDAGAGMVNDVRALREPDALAVVADSGVAVSLMHMQGEPRTMQDAPHYDDVTGEVHRFLAERIFSCQMAGIDKRRIVIDPGFGFGKDLDHNLQLLRDLARLTELGPVMAGLSRKAMVGTLTGQLPGEARAIGSAAAALIAVQNGAHIVRVHDVAATHDALAIWNAVAGLS